MSTKSLSDYMKMLNTVEAGKTAEDKEPEKTEEPIEEKVDVRNQDINKTWQASEAFLDYVKTNLDKLHDVMEEGLTDVICDGKTYTCNEYLIVGVTIEQGLMVVIRCEDEYEDHHAAHVEIKDRDVIFVEFID